MQRCLISIAALALLGFSSAAPGAALAAPVHKATQATSQQPRDAVPTHYAVSLTPDAADRSFSASVTSHQPTPASVRCTPSLKPPMRAA